ncbi:MAG TPA: hypothetical protein VN733_07510 [Solirubrobacterales bacterium]|nr:hypothetical protein [Solirubrobacterales bacterium]
MKRANAICDRVFARTGKQYSKLRYLNGGHATSTELNEAAQKFMVPALSRLARQLAALDAPPADDQRVEKMLASLDAGIEVARKDARTVRGETGPFAFRAAYEQMWALGLDKCGLS